MAQLALRGIQRFNINSKILEKLCKILTVRFLKGSSV